MNETNINVNYKCKILIGDQPQKPQKGASINDIQFEDVLVRFYDKKEFADDFISKGKILMRSLKTMRSLESFRQDSGDGIASQTYIDTSKFKSLNKPTIPIAGGTLGFLPLPDIIPVDLEPKCENIYIYCMSYLKIRNRKDLTEKAISQKLKEDYDIQRYAIIITDTQEFLNRIKNAVEHYFSNNYISLGLVEYKERTPFDYLGFQDGDLFFRSLCYRKDIRFSREHEFRTAVIDKTKIADNYFVEIGSLEDIAVIIDLEELL